jgi:hypothetical protein
VLGSFLGPVHDHIGALANRLCIFLGTLQNGRRRGSILHSTYRSFMSKRDRAML